MPIEPTAPKAPARKREFCPWCGAEDYVCERPFECEREIQADARAAMEDEIQNATERIREEYGYGHC